MEFKRFENSFICLFVCFSQYIQFSINKKDTEGAKDLVPLGKLTMLNFDFKDALGLRLGRIR